jgi:hypothetical protein
MRPRSKAGLFRLYSGSIQALFRLYSGSTQEQAGAIARAGMRRNSCITYCSKGSSSKNSCSNAAGKHDARNSRAYIRVCVYIYSKNSSSNAAGKHLASSKNSCSIAAGKHDARNSGEKKKLILNMHNDTYLTSAKSPQTCALL